MTDWVPGTRGKTRTGTVARRRILERLAAEPWQTTTQLHEGATGSVGNTYAAVQGLLALGWIEVRRDDGRERRAGVPGRRPRSVYQATAIGKTALIEWAMEELELGES